MNRAQPGILHRAGPPRAAGESILVYVRNRDWEGQLGVWVLVSVATGAWMA